MANRLMISLVALMGVFSFATPVFAQTLVRDGVTVALPEDIDVPRNQDNKPSVLARNPAPRTPDGKIDFTGVWTTPSNPGEATILTQRFGPNRTEPMALTPWAAERLEYNRDASLPGIAGRAELNPRYLCVPAGPAHLLAGWGSTSTSEMIQTPKRLMIIYEFGPSIRQIWTDGRKHPDKDELELLWMGHSIGSWEGDTLVVDTVGMRNESWMDGGGHVHSTDLRIVERYQRVDYDTLQIDITYHDPKTFTKPWQRRMFLRLRPDWELVEDVRCYEGNDERNAQKKFFDDMSRQAE
jgi:hypothetical protein